MNWRHAIPAFVSVAFLAAAVWGYMHPHASHGLATMIAGAIGYVIATDGLLLSLRDVRAPHMRGGKNLLIALKLAISAPTAGLLLASFVYAEIEGDLAWEGPQYALIPFAFVLPFVIAALTGDDGMPTPKVEADREQPPPQFTPARRYVMLAVLFFGSIGLLAEAMIFGTRVDPLVSWVGLGLYLAASIWWAAVITRPGPRLPIRLVVLWLPVLPGLGLLAATFAAVMREGEDPTALLLWLPLIFLIGLICLAATISALLRDDGT